MKIWNIVLAILAAQMAFLNSSARGDDDSIPHIVQQDGRYALFVDGAPYLMLGAQVNNSSGWPAVLPKVWPAMEFMHVNTVEIPVYWEQFEPEYGKFDYSVIDTLLKQAREEKLHLVLLWFGTWKNGSNHYMPQWMKLKPDLYPNMIGSDGKYIDSPNPLAKDTLTADIKAFTAFMRHLKEADPHHTVLMVQVENEAGAWGGVRDYSPASQAIFGSPVPSEVLKAMDKSAAKPTANWHDVFGEDADEFFQVWCVSKFIGQVAAAGKAAYPLPMYCNASLRDPLKPGRPPKYECGGPNDNVFPIWKAEAPAVDLLAPDIYQRETAKYLKVLDYYARPDNPLFIPEAIGQGAYSRFLFAALGHGAIGFSPFGLDYTRSFESPIDPTMTAEKAMAPTAQNYELFGPMSREIARLNFEGKLQTAIDEREPRQAFAELPPTADPENPRLETPDKTLHFKGWDVTIWFRPMRRGEGGAATQPAAVQPPNGRVLVAQLDNNQFLVTGLYSRVSFLPTDIQSHTPWQYLSVGEGKYENGQFKTSRILNGDQTDWGLIFHSDPSVLRVTLYLRQEPAMTESDGAVKEDVLGWLKGEGLIVLGTAILAYHFSGHSWWLFLILFLAPDISFLAYGLGPRVGGVIYNMFHSYIFPLILGCGLWMTGHSLAVPLIWVAHVGMDRLLGYGLKYPTGFGDTHLGKLGKRAVEPEPE